MTQCSNLQPRPNLQTRRKERGIYSASTQDVSSAQDFLNPGSGRRSSGLKPAPRSRTERDCASEASRSNLGIETCENNFYASPGNKPPPPRSGWGQLVPTTSQGTAEIMRPMGRIQPSLRDSKPPGTLPGVETPGYFRKVPPGLRGVAEAVNFRRYRAETSGARHLSLGH